MAYKASIFNVTKNKWLKYEKNGKVLCTNKENEKLVFYDEVDAESTLEFLNDNYADCYTLIIF